VASNDLAGCRVSFCFARNFHIRGNRLFLAYAPIKLRPRSYQAYQADPLSLRPTRQPGQSFPIEDTSSKIEVKEVLEALPEPDQKLLLDLLQAKEGGASDSAAIRQVTGQTGGTTYKRAKNLLAQFNKGAKDD
jgi:hypothetical protein